MDRADQSDCEEGNWREKQGVVAAVLVTDQRHVHSEVVVFVSTEASLHLWHQLVDENIYQRREGERGREGEREGEREREREREGDTTKGVRKACYEDMYNWVPCFYLREGGGLL